MTSRCAARASRLGRIGLVVAACALLWANGVRAQASAPIDPSVFGVYVGSTPWGEPVRQMLGLHPAPSAELMHWVITLRQDAATHVPTQFDLRYTYGPAQSGRPVTTVERHGSWTRRRRVAADPSAEVYDLTGTMSLLAVSPDVLHFLGADDSLMVGNGGWSYTLSRAARAEAVVRAPSTAHQPEVSYPIGPLAIGPGVFGVFEGRTPCQGIARELQHEVSRGCFKLKWRVTLLEDPETKTSTTYRVEGGLFPRGAREGAWTIVHGTATDPRAIVYRLAPVGAEPAILLLRGDANVVFFLNHDRALMAGNEEFAYTLDRKAASASQ